MTCAAVVPFKITILNPFGVQVLDDFHEASNNEDPFSFAGWDVDWSSSKKFGKKNMEIFGTPITKNKLKVYYVNEDQYADGGGVLDTFLAESKAELEVFLNDWGLQTDGAGLHVPIEENEIVQQNL